MRLDHDSQPDPWINARQRAERDISEMLGLAKGVILDGVVNELEADGLRRWLENRPDLAGAWPARVLLSRLQSIFEDGVVTEDEREDLKELLSSLVDGQGACLGGTGFSTTLPLDDPPPLVEIPNRTFVLTGKFAFGPRPICREAIRALGGWVEPGVTKRTEYLVIGTFGSRDWVQSSYGAKIEKAVKYREKYGAPAIVFEDLVAAQL